MSPAGWGAAIGAGFAALWGLAGAIRLPGAWRRRVVLVVLMACAGVVARAVLSRAEPSRVLRFDSLTYAIAAALGAAGALAATVLLRRGERRGLLGPVIAVIFGLHFIGLWLATGQRLALGVTCGMCAAALIALGWARKPGGVDPRLPIAGLGSAAVLWAASLASLG